MKKTSMFKVGDKVRVLDGSRIANYVGGWTDGMKKYVGKVFTVEDVEVIRNGTAYRLENALSQLGGCYIFDEKGLELADINEIITERVIIYTVGDRTVVAKDVKTGTTEYARCSPEDTFDFTIGAKLALDRLFERLELQKNKKPKFKVGDRIIGNALANRYGITKEGWLGEVTLINHETGVFEARSLKTGEMYYCLRDDSFDLCNYRVVPGDIVKVKEAIYGPAEPKLKIEIATKLTKNPEYLARLDFSSNYSTLKVFERTKVPLKVIAANENFAMVTEMSNIKATYIIGIKGLTRCPSEEVVNA